MNHLCLGCCAAKAEHRGADQTVEGAPRIPHAFRGDKVVVTRPSSHTLRQFIRLCRGTSASHTSTTANTASANAARVTSSHSSKTVRNLEASLESTLFPTKQLPVLGHLQASISNASSTSTNVSESDECSNASGSSFYAVNAQHRLPLSLVVSMFITVVEVLRLLLIL